MVGDETGFRWRRLSASLRGRLPDGMLVRISSIDPDPQRAWALHTQFARALLGAVDPVSLVHVAGPQLPA